MSLRTARLQRSPALLGTVVSFVLALVVALPQGEKPFYYDSGAYWALGERFLRDGEFALLNFDNGLRGYALPLLLYGYRELSEALSIDPSLAVKIFNAAVLACIGGVLAPALARLAWPERPWGPVRRVALTIVLLVFWHGYLSFPLSDFPALALALLAIVAVSRHESPAWLFIAGVAAALAINLRPAYILIVVVLILLLAFAGFKARRAPHTGILRLSAGFAALVLGFALVSLPQSLAMQRYHDTASFVPGAAVDLTSFQLGSGLVLQRYDTYVGTAAPGPLMRYIDPVGERLLAEQEGGTIPGSAEYLDLILTRPIAMAGVFSRHVINGLDPRYPTPYIERLDTSGSNRPLRLAGFLLVFLALLRLGWPAARRELGPANWHYPLALAVLAATVIPSAIETRFMLPVYLLCYVLVLAGLWPNPVGARDAGPRRLVKPAVIAVAYAVFMVVVYVVVDGATDNLYVVKG